MSNEHDSIEQAVLDLHAQRDELSRVYDDKMEAVRAVLLGLKEAVDAQRAYAVRIVHVDRALEALRDLHPLPIFKQNSPVTVMGMAYEDGAFVSLHLHGGRVTIDFAPDNRRSGEPF